MFSKIKNWIKANKLVSIIIIVLLFLLLKNSFRPVGMRRLASFESVDSVGIAPMAGVISNYNKSYYSAVSETAERKVVTNSSFSLLVKKVNNALDSIRGEAVRLGGYVTNVSVSRDEQANKATIEIRVPSDKLEEYSKYLRSISVKVVYENIIGHDITDKYTDYVKRLESLENAKAKLEAILNRAVTADEILNVQTRIFEVQDQIDSIKGQITYMYKASETSKVSIVLSTDEMALPYTPVKSWRPDTIFKEAIRALIGLLITIGSAGIWFVVFSPLIALFFVIKKLVLKRRR